MFLNVCPVLWLAKVQIVLNPVLYMKGKIWALKPHDNVIKFDEKHPKIWPKLVAWISGLNLALKLIPDHNKWPNRVTWISNQNGELQRTEVDNILTTACCLPCDNTRVCECHLQPHLGHKKCFETPQTSTRTSWWSHKTSICASWNLHCTTCGRYRYF